MVNNDLTCTSSFLFTATTVDDSPQSVDVCRNKHGEDLPGPGNIPFTKTPLHKDEMYEREDISMQLSLTLGQSHQERRPHF